MSSEIVGIIWLVAFAAVCLWIVRQLFREHKSQGMGFSGLGGFLTIFRGRGRKGD